MIVNISNMPQEILCKILEFLPIDSYFKAIDSDVFPIDDLQYNRKLDIRCKNEREHNLIVEAHEKYKRIRQGKILILSCVQNFFPQYQEFVDLHIHEWNDEIDQYFDKGKTEGNGMATILLNFVLNE